MECVTSAMGLILRQRFFKPLGMRNFDVCDETGKRVFLAEQQLRFPRCWHLLDAAERHVATVQKRFRRIVLLTPDGERSDIVRRRGLRRKFRFSVSGWRAECAAFSDDFIVRTAQGETIAVAEGAPEKNSLRIETVREKDVLPVLLFAVAVRKYKSGLRI